MNETVVDYYKVLNLNINCSSDEVVKNYSNLKNQFNPDINDSSEYIGSFKLIFEAYFVLNNSDFRKRYDSIFHKNDLSAFKLFRKNMNNEIKKSSEEMSKLEMFFSILGTLFS
jgi:DnaJ-class molecular chaperone